jgi:hypothetical protein
MFKHRRVAGHGGCIGYTGRRCGQPARCGHWRGQAQLVRLGAADRWLAGALGGAAVRQAVPALSGCQRVPELLVVVVE